MTALPPDVGRRPHLPAERRAIRHAEIRDLAGRNVAALIKAPGGRPGRPSKSLTLEEAHSPPQAGRGARLAPWPSLGGRRVGSGVLRGAPVSPGIPIPGGALIQYAFPPPVGGVLARSCLPRCRASAWCSARTLGIAGGPG